MSHSDFPTTWRDPQYISTVAGVLATGALYVFSAIAHAGPTTGEITFVLLAVTLPAGAAYEIARRLS